VAGPALGRLEIPRLGIGVVVVEGTDARTLELAVGHIASTAPPGRPGNCGLAGHRDTFFSGLGGARVGDLVRFSTPQRTYTYEVEWCQVVDPDRVDTLDPTPVPSLTLVTCYPFAFVGHAPQRFVVRARQVKAPEVPVLAQARAILSPPILMAAGR
jgi:sortase A